MGPIPIKVKGNQRISQLRGMEFFLEQLDFLYVGHRMEFPAFITGDPRQSEMREDPLFGGSSEIYSLAEKKCFLDTHEYLIKLENKMYTNTQKHM